MKRYSCLAALGFLLLASAAAGDDGVASGKLTLGGKSAALTHAYAVARPDSVLVILSDAPIPADSLWDDFPGLKLAAAGQLHAILVVLNADRTVKSAAILHNAFSDSDSFYGLTAPNVELKTFDGKRVDGKLSSVKAEQLMNKSFDFSATFSAPIQHRPAPTATGAAAAQTEPGKVVLAFLKAFSAGDKARMRKLLTAEYGKPLDGPQGNDILKAWTAARPDMASQQIATVEIHGNTAIVTMTDGATKFTLTLEGGEWKIDSAMM